MDMVVVVGAAATEGKVVVPYPIARRETLGHGTS